jgi:hypothetical protein
VLSALFGAGYVGLRSLASGLPASFLLGPRRALADGAAMCAAKDKAQFIIFNTSGAGDPINASVPGTYEDANIVHSPDPALAPAKIMLGGRSVTAAAPWATLGQAVLDRTCFFHMATTTPVHPKEPEVLALMGAAKAGEMLPSLLAKQLAPCLGTIQAQPLSLGALNSTEALSFGGATQPVIPALALKATLTSAPGPLTDLQALRDQTLGSLYDLYKHDATPSQQAYIDSLVTSQQQVRNINQSLLDALSAITDNSAASQILAAVTLVQMKVTPVIAVHIPFGGDNHRDVGLATETAETLSGIQAIADLMQKLSSAGLSDQVTFMSLNVFGRTLGPGNEDGRQHNPNHHVSVAIGKGFAAGVIGGVAPVEKDYGALAIDSKTGQGAQSGDIAATDTLASFGKTMLASIGTHQDTIDSLITTGKVVPAALR